MKMPFLSLARRISVSRICKDDRGLSTVEYAIILVLVAVFAIATWSKFGNTVKTKIDDSNSTVDSMPVNPDGYHG